MSELAFHSITDRLASTAYSLPNSFRNSIVCVADVCRQQTLAKCGYL